MEFIDTFNHYYRYVYIPVGIALLAALIYLLVNLLPLFRTLKTLTPGISSITGKLDEIKGKTAKIQYTIKRTGPVLAAGIAAFTGLSLVKRILKKDDAGERHPVENIRKEINKYNTKVGTRKLVGDAGNIARRISAVVRR